MKKVIDEDRIGGLVMTIETERLILRTFQEGDEEDVFEYLEEPAVDGNI